MCASVATAQAVVSFLPSFQHHFKPLLRSVSVLIFLNAILSVQNITHGMDILSHQKNYMASLTQDYPRLNQPCQGAVSVVNPLCQIFWVEDLSEIDSE